MSNGLFQIPSPSEVILLFSIQTSFEYCQEVNDVLLSTEFMLFRTLLNPYIFVYVIFKNGAHDILHYSPFSLLHDAYWLLYVSGYVEFWHFCSEDSIFRLYSCDLRQFSGWLLFIYTSSVVTVTFFLPWTLWFRCHGFHNHTSLCVPGSRSWNVLLESHLDLMRDAFPSVCRSQGEVNSLLFVSFLPHVVLTYLES